MQWEFAVNIFCLCVCKSAWRRRALSVVLFVFCEIIGQTLVWETINSSLYYANCGFVGGKKSSKYFYRMFRNVIHLVKTTSVIYCV